VNKDNKTVKQTFPAYCKSEINLNECDTSRYFDLCPDDSKKSVIYLEDKGIRFKQIDGTKIYFTASVDLVGWLNLALLGVSDCSFSARCITSIISSLIGKGTPFQSGIYQRVIIRPVFEQSKSINPFLKYSYNIDKQQLLMHPYDFFVLTIEVDFVIDSRCIEEIVLNPPIDCLKS
jgi:hypothetical protein